MAGQSLLRVDKRTYEVARAERILTPALLVYPEWVRHNIQTTLRLLEGNAKRLRPHVKTAKQTWVVRELVKEGVSDFKCATTLELLTAASAGARDVLVAYPVAGPHAQRVRDIAAAFPGVAVSALVESSAMVAEWAGENIGLFVDVNPGMDRTGISPERAEEIVGLATAILRAKIPFRGLHYYDGQFGALPLAERTPAAHRGYDRLLEIVAALGETGIPVPCVITAGTPTFPCSLSYAGFLQANFQHHVSPGTLIFNDMNSLRQLPAEWDYRPAALVLSRVVSRPKPNVATCDAGHKAVSADSGVPNCVVLGREDLEPLAPSEEHLPLRIPEGSRAPERGELLYLLPKHVCPTVNNFDHALIVEQGKIARLDRVAARGRENPLILSLRQMGD